MITAHYFHQGAHSEPKVTATLQRQIQDQLESGRGVLSASGFTAAIAMNICATKGWSFTMLSHMGRYYLQRDGLWFKVEEKAPPQRTLLEVCGLSGYRNHPQFLTLATYDEEYRPRLDDGRIRWLDVTNDGLLDKSWEPTHWRFPHVLPPVEEMTK